MLFVAQMKSNQTNLFMLIVLVLLLNQCKVNKNNPSAKIETRELQEIIISESAKKTAFPYQESQKRTMDLLHTTLWLSFDYNKQHVLGKAKLTFKPYFYAQQELKLDAKKFLIHKVVLASKDSTSLKYTYDESVLTIKLNKTYTRTDTFSVYIEYTARPNEIGAAGSAAITDAKGLYFINPTKSDPNKPRQIWSQGETQSNSGWFPTIDYPNEKMTQEIYLTVDQSDITLSNGILLYSKENPDGTRTDYWSQTLPHAPYLTMIAVGEFTETKDMWRDSVEVNYYLEKKYSPYANLIFGKTPEMMECFSKRLGVAYPWEKFSQIVVRDFVSGAMENTSAVIHFEPVQHDSREHLDNTWEDIIAHELFHHWFGDLVTCESWSNISLNESFATYGEYLWNEYAYGKLYADYDFDDNLVAYLGQKSAAKRDLIRFHYQSREDVFDVVSYQKGSRILHMLRNYIGDDAFFASLKLYLTKHQFKTAEVHDLRLAFEEVTGEDLNWFFNQWYLNSGHPILDVQYTYNETATAVKISINQVQDTNQVGVYKLPVAIDVYNEAGKATRHKVWVDKAHWEMVIDNQAKIELTTFDADRILLAKITENKTAEEFAFQFYHAPHYLDKEQAANALAANGLTTVSPLLTKGIEKALTDTFFGMRELGLQLLTGLPEDKRAEYEQTLIAIATKDQKASVRADAIEILSDWNAPKYESLFVSATNDSSYSVVGTGLIALADINSQRALTICKTYMDNNNKKLQMSIANVIGDHAEGDYVSYFETLLNDPSYYSYTYFAEYANYLTRQDTSIQIKALPQLQKWHSQSNQQFHYSSNVEKCVGRMQKFYDDQQMLAIASLKNKKLTESEKQKWQLQQATAISMLNRLSEIVKSGN